MRELIVTVAYHGSKKKPRPIRPLPRPRTARDRVRLRQLERKHDHIVAQLTRAATEGRRTMADVVTDRTHAAAAPRTRPSRGHKWGVK